jgi:hypothetical protein
MKRERIAAAVTEARRFLKAVARLEARNPQEYEACSERAAVRRSSLDLSRALAAMRKR